MWISNKRYLPTGRHLSLALSLGLCIGAMPGSAHPAQSLRASLTEAIRDGDYLPASPEELERAKHLFLKLAQGALPDELADEASRLAVRIERLGPLILVREEENARRGRGFFVFRRGGESDVLLIPHGFKDEMTRDIGLKLFIQGRFAAAAWNTVPRHFERNGLRVDADMAHLPATWFMAFTLATASAWPDSQTLQIHGFDQNKRKSNTAADADLILSNGTSAPDPRLRRQQQCLSSEMTRSVLLYPDSTSELGGTTNAQASALRKQGYRGFIHLEISRSLRLALRDDEATRAVLLRCLQP